MLNSFVKSNSLLYRRQILNSVKRCCATNLATIEVEDLGPVRLITMNRPEKLNALSTRASDEILSTLREVDNRPYLKVSILTGKGNVSSLFKTRYFSSSEFWS